MRLQIVTSYIQTNDNEDVNVSQSLISSQTKRRKDLLPYAFTEHGVTMLASVLKSPIARTMNIAIVRVFIALREFVIQYKDILEQLDGLREKIGSHDAQLNHIYEALENMLDKNVEEENKLELWKNRKQIGFKR